MDTRMAAVVIQETSKFLSYFLKSRQFKSSSPVQDIYRNAIEENSGEVVVKDQGTGTSVEEPRPEPIKLPETPSTDVAEEATSIPTGCVPCALGHYGGCSGMLNESMRFARSDGMASNEVLDRVGMCLDELNAMERKDLRPQMIAALPGWEKDLAEKALDESRAIRHDLENLTTVDELEKVAAKTQTVRQELYRTWAKKRLSNMTPEERTKTVETVLDRLNVEGDND